MRNVTCTSLGALVLLVGWSATAAWCQDATEGRPAKELTQNQLDARVAELIEQLGAARYATREQAQVELRRLGLTAFDALHAAQDHDDIEIALRARRLVGSMQVNWWRDSDSIEVRRLLKDYGQLAEDQRRNRLDKLSERDAIDAICRLARFETSDVVSKYAALLIMKRADLDNDEARKELGQQIQNSLGQSRRVAGQWLNLLSRTLDNAESTLADWQKMARQERETLAQFPERTSRQISRDLLRWNADLLIRHDRDREAADMIRLTFALLDGTPDQLLDVVDWLITRKSWKLVDEIARQFPVPFESNARLMYRLAESQLKQDRTVEAQRTADRALSVKSGDVDEHILAAFSLQERGLFEWAEREYDAAIDNSESGSSDNTRARFLLSEMQHDQQQHGAAAETLQVVVDELEKNEKLAAQLNREPGAVRSRMYFFHSLDHKKNGRLEEQIKSLREGVKHDPNDADLLIAMYRTEGADDEFRKETMAHIGRAADRFRQDIAQYREQVDRAPQEEFRAWAERQLATANNQLAWLVGNTEGDFDEAVQCSHRSLELRPGASGYLDTLGRCYYAKGDYDNAIKYQSMAVKLEPHSGQIRRQLEMIQQAQQDADNNRSSQ